jgi:hypothetical protein
MARNVLIQIRRDTAANWASVNPVLAQGEFGLTTDTNVLKVGDGSTAWSTLANTFAATNVANTFTVGPQTVNTGATGNKGLIVNAPTGQSVNLQEWQVNGVTSALVDNGGNIRAANFVNFTTFNNSRLTLSNSGAVLDVGVASNKVVTVKGAASQTADLIQTQNSSGTVLGGLNAVGQIFTGLTSGITGAVGGTIQSIATGANPLVTMASAHGLSAGDLVTLAGTTGGTYNGTFSITSPSGSTFNIVSALTAGQASPAGTASVPAQASITARDAGTKGLVVQGATSQAVDLQSWQNSGGTTVASIQSAGALNVSPSAAVNGYAAFIKTPSASAAALQLRAAASQTANVQEWQDSSGAAKAVVTKDGLLPTGTAARYIKTGYIYAPIGLTSPTTTSFSTTMIAVPIYVPATATAVSLSINVATLNGASSVVRLGIYTNSTTDDYPNALVVDAGTVPTDTVGGSTGINTLTISQSLTAGLYWLVAVKQGTGTPTGSTFSNTQTQSVMPWAATGSIGTLSGSAGWGQTGITAALPSTFTATKTIISANAPAIWLGF